MCEVSTVNKDGRSVGFKTDIEVASTAPTLSDLVCIILSNALYLYDIINFVNYRKISTLIEHESFPCVCSFTLSDLRPDLIMVSKKTKQLGIVELTVPNEDRVEVSGELKRRRYEPIVQEGRQYGWSESLDSRSWV